MAATLPQNLDAEKVCLGSILLDDVTNYSHAAELRKEDFALDSHRRIFGRMKDIHERGERIDTITVANELMKFGEMESVGGLTYLNSLDEGLPQLANVPHYVAIVREKSALRRLIFLNHKASQVAQSQEHAPSKIIRDLSKSLTKMEMSLGTSKILLSPQDILDEHGGVSNFLQHAIKPGISTGFPQIDEYTMGLQESCHYIIGGRTGAGKTGMAENIGINVAKDGHPVCFFSLEMSKELVMARAICCEARVPFKAYIKNDMDPDQRHAVADALATITSIPFFVDDAADLTMGEFLARADRAVAEKHIRLFLLDYLQIMNAEPELELRTEYDRVTYASKLCRMMARKHKCSSIAVSQLSRSPDKRKPGTRPTLSELKSCLPKDTLLASEDGRRIPISKIRPGDRIFGVSPSQKTIITTVGGVWKTGVRSVFSITTETKKTVTATSNHPFLTPLGYKALDSLKIGDLVGCSMNIPSSDITWEKIISITPLGESEVWDLTASKTGNFIAENFVVHNSGGIENDAAAVILIHRPEMFDHTDTNLKFKAEAIVAKSRVGGQGTVHLEFTGKYYRFEDKGPPLSAPITDDED